MTPTPSAPVPARRCAFLKKGLLAFLKKGLPYFLLDQ
jgi:hypothetical protein